MNISHKIILAGLSKDDSKILSALQKVATSKILPLAKCLSLPRTTVSFRLRKLAKRKLVEKTKIGHHIEWRLSEDGKSLFLEKSAKNDFAVKKYSSNEEVRRLIQKFIEENPQHRIYFIEPYLQSEKLLKNINPTHRSQLQRLFRERGNISEGITDRKNLELVEQYETEVLESMLGRMVILHIIPDEYMQFQDIIYVKKNSVYIMNFVTNNFVEIESQSFAKSIKSLILALKHFGKKIDLNEYIRDVLKRKNVEI